MGIFSNKKDRLNEATKSFKTKLKSKKENTGEGYEDINLTNQSLMDSLSSFNLFYDNHINKNYENEIQKIYNYRSMSAAPEISDVIEDAVIEATQEDTEGRILHLDFTDEELKKNDNKTKTLKEEFNELFYNRLKIQNEIWSIFYSYFIDGRIFLERIGKNKYGIINFKKLPSETMDYKIDSHGKIEFFVQYLNRKAKLPNSIEEAEKEKDKLVVFYPSQISFINSGMFGENRKDIIGYLEKSKQPYNQLKLLETAVIIYRIIRAPERLVFRIDTGNMPQDKAMKFVEKVKRKFQQKQTYDPDTGQLINKPAIASILDNYFLPQCLRLDTNIPLANKENKTLSQIIDDYNNGIKNYVHSVDQKTGEKVKGEIEWAGITRRNAELIRIWLENDEYIDVTPDHKFCVWKDETKTEIIEVEAQNLTEEMDLVDYE